MGLVLPFLALNEGHDGMRQKKAPLWYFFQPSCALQEAFKFSTLICKRILVWLWRGRRLLSVLTDHQIGWKLLVCSSLHKSPAIISICLFILLSCASGGMGEGLLSLSPPKAGTSYLLFIEACSRQAI